jgi:aldehyde:ferredoxin oxidoreductase
MVDISSLKLITEWTYERAAPDKGYTGKTLYVNVGEGRIEEKPVTDQMKDIFIGGKGFDLWLMWNAVTGDTKWDDPENEICISSGPLGGTVNFPGSGKSLVTTISPLTNIIIDSNVGGHFGPFLKFSGWDALELQGISEEELILLIDGQEGRVALYGVPEGFPTNTYELAEQLTFAFASDEGDRKNVAVVSSGPGAEHARFGCLNFSWYDARRGCTRLKQAGRGGIGTVFRHKKIRALVVHGPGVKQDSNAPADIGRVKEWGTSVSKEIRDHDDEQCRMRQVGTMNLTEVMDDYDLLPTHNYKFGSHKETPKIASPVFKEKYFTQGVFDGCWIGCTMSCCKAVENFMLKTGPNKGQGVIVDGPEYETVAGCGSNMGIFDPESIIEQNFYCDTYGLDTISWGTSMAFVMECYENGILNKERTGGLELPFGAKDAALEVLHQIGKGEGFGLVVGQGIRRMKKKFVEEYGADEAFLNDIGMESKGLEYSEYITKESLAQQGGYGLTLKGPQHDEAWLIFLDQVNNFMPTFEQKAEALHWFPMFRTWFGLNGLCKLPWNDIVPPENAGEEEPAKVMKHVRGYSNFFSGVTGMELDPDGIIAQSEKVYNFQRVFSVRMGYGTREHDTSPYRATGPVTAEEYESRAERYDKQLKETVGYDPEGKGTEEKMAALREYREAQYEKLKDAVYKRRGWNNNGVPTLEKVKELGIDFPDVVKVLEPYQ